MIYHVYILKSLVDGSYYIGYTHNLVKRLSKHNTSLSGYTSRKKPWKIVYSEPYESKALALKRENYLKRMKSINFIEDLIKHKST